MKRKLKFDPTLQVKVKFIGEEDTQDGGGSRSEMLRLAIQQLCQSDLFLQTADGFVPTCGSLSLNREDYVAVGQLFALSLVQLGPAPHGMHPVITQALCGKSHTQIEVLGQPAVEDPMTSVFLDKLKAVSSHDDLKRFLQEDSTLNILQLVQWTIPAGKMTMKDVTTLKRVVILHDLIFKRKPAIEQMREGLVTLGILGHKDENSSLFQGVFSHKKEGWNQMT
ncbi:G2/M phase-specific E3 ubiquitin-protein ligase-like [Branchiostoma floridae x Branchiostoma japonicum]